MSSATEVESCELHLCRYYSCGGDLMMMMTPRERRWKAYEQNAFMELINVRRWCVKEFPQVIRERVMTFVDNRTASPIAYLEIAIHRPELANALKRPPPPEPVLDFPFAMEWDEPYD